MVTENTQAQAVVQHFDKYRDWSRLYDSADGYNYHFHVRRNRVLELLPEVGRRPQDDSLATYAPKIGKEEARLDFSRPAIEVERQIRAFNPAPGAFFLHKEERIKILAAAISDEAGTPGELVDEDLTIACGTGSIRPTQVQRAGRAAMSPDDLLRGFAIPRGTRLT